MINRYRVKICGITDEVNYSELKKISNRLLWIYFLRKITKIYFE